VTELLLFGIRGKLRTRAAGRRQVNVIKTRKQEHSRKPDQAFDIIEQCSPGPYLELFARFRRDGWAQWGDQVESYEQTRPFYSGYNGHAYADGKNGAQNSAAANAAPRRRGRPRKVRPTGPGLFQFADDAPGL
jgi:hypothetical protein